MFWLPLFNLCPCCHISKHPQQLAGLTLVNGFVNLINICNKYYLHIHVIAVHYFKVLIVTIIARLWQYITWQKRLHFWAFCPTQWWAFCPACIFFLLTKKPRRNGGIYKCNEIETKSRRTISNVKSLQMPISVTKPSNRLTSMTRKLHEIGRKYSQTWQDAVVSIINFRLSYITQMSDVILEPSPFIINPPANDDWLHGLFYGHATSLHWS